MKASVTTITRINTTAILGALIADAASLGLHWLYCPVRIAEIEAVKGLTFLSPNLDDYSGTPSFFAHKKKVAGDSSGYGEVCLLMLKHLAKHGAFKRMAYQMEFCQHFGEGGAYVGYIDHPTRYLLLTLNSLEPAKYPAVSGSNDDQLPALSALPALVATHRGTREALLCLVEEVVRVTNNNALAISAAQCAAAALFAVLNGVPLEKALSNALLFAGETLQPLLEDALAEPLLDSVAAGKRFGMNCRVVQGLPIIFHIAKTAPDYRTAIEANIRAGGDSCGRSIMLGALVAAHQLQQSKDEPVFPPTWLAQFNLRALTEETFASFGAAL
ncbi:MAG: ADP-ribosylglycohydrolase family protein [Methylophilaceae bacterium]